MSRSLLSVAFLFVSIFFYQLPVRTWEKVPEESQNRLLPPSIREKMSPIGALTAMAITKPTLKQDGDKYRADFSPSGKWVENRAQHQKRKNYPMRLKQLWKRNIKDVKNRRIGMGESCPKGNLLRC